MLYEVITITGVWLKNRTVCSASLATSIRVSVSGWRLISVSAKKYVPFFEFRMCMVPKCLYSDLIPITSFATFIVLVYLVSYNFV